MKKILCLLSLLLLLAFLLIGCKEDAPSTSPSDVLGGADLTDTTVSVNVYIDGALSQTLITNNKMEYKITPPEKMQDITKDRDSKKYFYGWFIDEICQTRLTEDTSFENGGAIYAMWLDVHPELFTYTLDGGKATITGFLDPTATDVVVPCYIDSHYVETVKTSAFPAEMEIDTLILCEGIAKVEGKLYSACASIKYAYLPESLISIGRFAFYDCKTLSFIEIPQKVFEIGESAFSGCSSLTSLALPNGVVSIGRSAFYKCSGITSFTIPSGVSEIATHTFMGCSGLTSVTLPSRIASIGMSAFCDCSSLASITIPTSVQSIDAAAFKGCTAFTSFTIPSNVTSVGESAFEGCTGLSSVDISEGVTSFGAYAFKGCTGLTSIAVPDSITSIGRFVFEGCSSLGSITVPFVGKTEAGAGEGLGYFFGTNSVSDMDKFVPASLKSVVVTRARCINTGAFQNCSGLTSITLSDALLRIENGAFNGCSALLSITIPDTVLSIGDHAFASCSSLTSVIIPNSVTSIGDGAFMACTGLTSISIPGSVTAIPANMLERCIALTSVTISKNVTSIGSCAFKECAALESIMVESGNAKYHGAGNCLIETASKTLIAGCKSSIIPTDGSVTAIGPWAFAGCSGLTSITIPACVSTIDNYVFYACSGLENITVESGNVNYHAVANCLIQTASKTLIAGCKNSIIPTDGSVISIGPWAFAGCSSLTAITIPNCVSSIGESAFLRCTGLTAISIPSSVMSIGASAFKVCDNLTSASFEATTGWKVRKQTSTSSVPARDLADAATAASCLTATYANHSWTHTQ